VRTKARSRRRDAPPALTSVGEIVTFTSFAGLLVTRLEQAVAFANRLYLDVPRLREFFDVMDTVPSVRDAPDAIDPAAVPAPKSSTGSPTRSTTRRLSMAGIGRAHV